MLKKEDIIFISSLLVMVILLIASQLYLITNNFYSISADEAGHTLEAFYWFKGDADIFSIWLPFQKILYGLSFHIHSDLILVPRVLSSLFGIITLLSIVFLTYELFQNKIISIVAGFLASLSFGIVIFSVLPLTEIYFFFFITASLAFLFRWIRTNSSKCLWLSVIFSSIGTATRYEAWVFSFFLFLVILIHFHSSNEERRIKNIKTIVVIIILSLFPVFWLYSSYTSTGEVSGFISSVSERYSPGEGIMEIKNNILFNFISINFTSLSILGIVALIVLYKENKAVPLYSLIFFSTLLIMSLVSFFSKTMPTHNSWRLAAVWSILLIPFTAYWLYLIFSGESKISKYNFIFFTFLLIYLFNSQTMNYAKTSYMTKDDISAGIYINSQIIDLDTESLILIEENRWDYTSILISSGNPDRFITATTFFKSLELKSKTEDKSIEKYLRSSGINCLVLKPGSRIKYKINSLQELKRFNKWVIYKLN